MKPLASMITPLVQRQEAPEEEELQAKPLVQRQEAAPEEEELQAKPLVQRQEAAPEEEELQAKPLVQRQEAAPEEEELQAKPLVQRQEAAPEEEELQAKPLVQRQEAAPEEEELQAKPLVQRQEAAPEEEELQMKPSPQQSEASHNDASENLENQLNSSKGGGSPLPDDVRSFMEPRFGADFSQVRVHTDSQAVQMNQAVGAQAFTHGSDIYFGAGKSPAVSDLTAHELTHVVQQTGGVQLANNVQEDVDSQVQRQTSSKSAASSGVTSSSGSPAKPSHYRIELKAWIPHDKVVDPEEPIRKGNYLDTLSLPTSLVGLNYVYSSRYHGDNHAAYSGDYRVLSSVEFDYDGTSISGFKHIGTYGESIRYWDAEVKLLGRSVYKTTGDERKTASAATSGSPLGKGFSMGIASANPLTIFPAPDINSNLDGSFDSSGQLSLNYKTDLFPSHGVQVQKDGVLIHTSIVNDASGVNALGPTGAANVGTRLIAQVNTGTISLPGIGLPKASFSSGSSSK